MAMPQFSMRELIEAGVHFGHKTHRWNPSMAPYLFGVRNDIHIIDLQQTVPLLHRALEAVRDVISNNGRVLFVGTKRQASQTIAEEAARCGQYYVNHRWLGGMLTNWRTVSQSIKALKKLEEQLGQQEDMGLTKKELLQLTRQREKLEKSLGGIKDMGGLPDIIFVIDTNKESLAIQEAQKLGIPVVAVLDSNSDPTGIAYPIPGNDDATKSIRLYCRLVSDAVLEGIQASLQQAGVDIGESENVPAEKLVEKKEEQEEAKSEKKTAKKKKVVVENPKGKKAPAKKAKAEAEEAKEAEAAPSEKAEEAKPEGENKEEPAKKVQAS